MSNLVPEMIKCHSCGQEILADAKKCRHCYVETIVGRESAASKPASAVLCQISGAVTLGLGIFLLAVSTGGTSVALPIAVMISSVVWFAIARAIILLAEIAFNTRRP